MQFLCGLRNNRSNSKQAHTPLVAAAISLIDILDEFDQYPALYLNHRILQNAIFRYEHRWIPVLASVNSSQRLSLVPPLDVEWVWFCHMLSPLKYISDSAAMWNSLRPDEHDFIIDHKLLPSPDRHEGKRKAALIWSEMFPDESFDILRSLKESRIHELVQNNPKNIKRNERNKKPPPESNISYDLIAAAERHMSFHYQVAIMPQYRDKVFLRHSVKRYNNMFLKLQKRFPDKRWVPTCDIHVIWHVHMLHPRWYKESTERLLGSVLQHDYKLNQRSTGSHHDDRWKATVKKWNKLFREPIVRDGGMWRGSVEGYERMERTRIKRLEQIVENRVTATIEKFSSSYPNKKSQGIQFSITYGGDVNWKDYQVEWVHMTDWRRANRAGRSRAEAFNNKIERLTFLRHVDLPRLLTCRTLHFLMYNNRNQPCNFGTILEVFGVGTYLDVPLATAHYAPLHSLCKDGLTTSTACTRRMNEGVLLLRVAGEDFGLLSGRWTGLVIPNGGTGLTEPTQGVPGNLELRLWLLGNNSTEQWLTVQRAGGSKDPGKYSLELPILQDCQITSNASVKFDFKDSTVFTEHPRHVVPAYLISMAAATLHVTLQPRYSPTGWKYVRNISKMYPEWRVSQNQYDMLRGAGGEITEKVGKRGLWTMILPMLGSSKNTTGKGFPLSFSESFADMRAPPGAVFGGCDGCGGDSHGVRDGVSFAVPGGV